MASEPAPPKKRSLFTAKALARKNKPVVEDEAFNFSRAQELSRERFAEEERRRLKREMRLKRLEDEAKEEEINSKKVNDGEETDTRTPPKKRKVSAEVSVESESADKTSPFLNSELETTDRSGRYDSITSPKERHDSLSARYAKSLQQKPKTSAASPTANVISLSDSEDGDDGPSSQKIASQTIRIDNDDDSMALASKKSTNTTTGPTRESLLDEEEEFPELVAQAMERERLKVEAAKKSFTEKNHSQDNHDSFGFEAHKDLDPSVEILITSDMDGAIPLKVKRKMSQKLREARYAWCDRQNFPQFSAAQLRSAVFLTWKREKVYDYTTCQALVLKPDHSDSISGMEAMYEDKIHLEAWTENAFAKAQNAENDEDGHVEEVQVEEEVKIKLVMTARDTEPLKLVVRKSTVLLKLVGAFVQARDIPEDKEVSLYFDGDELDLDGLVENTELDDMDNVEVHIK